MVEEKLKGPILLIEDNRPILEVIMRRLEKEGYFVVGFRNGIEAIREIEAGLLYKLAIIDLELPIVDGMEVMRVSKMVNPNVPVGCYSGYDYYPRDCSDFIVRKLEDGNLSGDTERIIKYYESLVRDGFRK